MFILIESGLAAKRMLSVSGVLSLCLAIALALAFEFVNGFHDTANAVATVIYTRTLPPRVAVVWSGVWNLVGVLTSSGAVAFAVLALLPVELVLNVGSGAGFAMVFALLISSMIWNLGTWFLGLPASSSHTLIGSILGVGLANSLLTSGGTFGEGVNWGNAREVGLSLLVSPIIGFCCAGGLLLLSRALIKSPALYLPPKDNAPPPLGVRSLLVLTCTGVSFAHGSNDGQKGMGLILLILIGIVPATYAINPHADNAQRREIASMIGSLEPVFERRAAQTVAADANAQISDYLKRGQATPADFAALSVINRRLEQELSAPKDQTDARKLRTDIYLMSKSLGKLESSDQFNAQEKDVAVRNRVTMEKLVNYIPVWVKGAVALALGLGTMIGWKRIVVTVGEKIGKAHLSYAQGASAELVAAGTIAAADWFGLPVSTTHVLSSGVAGAMVANHSGLQMDTVRNLCLAWVLTLPACVLLGATLFGAALYLFLHVAGLR